MKDQNQHFSGNDDNPYQFCPGNGERLSDGTYWVQAAKVKVGDIIGNKICVETAIFGGYGFCRWQQL
ncbi:MAG: hypothetical protein ACK5BE_05760 [Alphaproteobacteria bacterium]